MDHSLGTHQKLKSNIAYDGNTMLDQKASKKQDFAGYSLLIVVAVELYFTCFITFHYVKAPKDEPDDDLLYTSEKFHDGGNYAIYSKRESVDAGGIHIVITNG